MTPSDLVHYLLENNLITPDFILNHNVTVVDFRSRNNNFKVVKPDQSGLFVKQAPISDRPAKLSLLREANWYQLLNSHEEFSTIRPYFPVYICFDKKIGLLAIELISKGISIRDFHNSKGSFPLEVGRLLGESLASIHAIRNLPKHLLNQEVLSQSLPRILAMESLTQWLSQAVSPANVDLSHIVQQFPEFDQLISKLRDQWQPQCLIHGDVKWDNAMLWQMDRHSIPQSIKLIDWEAVGWGDPGWDVGAVFHGYLAYWIWSMEITEADTPPDLMQRAKYPIELMTPAINEFWRAYVSASNLHEAARKELLMRSISYGAARLLQTAYESMYQSSHLTPQTIYLLQLCMNVLSDPEETSEVLLDLQS